MSAVRWTRSSTFTGASPARMATEVLPDLVEGRAAAGPDALRERVRAHRRGLRQDHGELVASLGGTYRTAGDMNISPEDLDAFQAWAMEQEWSDGLPVLPPTEARVAKVELLVRATNEPAIRLYEKLGFRTRRTLKVRIPAVHSPIFPNGIRYGRGTSGWLYLSLITEGKIRRYTIVTMEMTTPRVALKYFAVLPLVSVRVRMRTMVDTTPETRFTTIGVPRRFIPWAMVNECNGGVTPP